MDKLTASATLAKWQMEAAQSALCRESGKKKYPTLAEAEARRDDLTHRTGTRGAVYFCRNCKTFHMTRHRPKNGDKSAFLNGAPQELLGRRRSTPGEPRR